MARTQKGVWSQDYIDELPDSSFLYIKPGGEKDDEWRTVPRSNRMWPVLDAEYTLDKEKLLKAISDIESAGTDIIATEDRIEALLKAEGMLMGEIRRELPKAGVTPEIASDLLIAAGLLERRAKDFRRLAGEQPAEEAQAPTQLSATAKSGKEWPDDMAPERSPLLERKRVRRF